MTTPALLAILFVTFLLGLVWGAGLYSIWMESQEKEQ